MPRFAKLFFENQFACGLAGYMNSHPARGENRIVLTIRVEGQLTQAFLDTAFGPYEFDVMVSPEKRYHDNM